MEKSEIVMYLIEKTIGKINPVADASIDSERLENLQVYVDVFREMNNKLNYIISSWNDTNFGSVKPFIDLCKKTQNEIKTGE